MNIVYLAHDLDDPAVARRIRMLTVDPAVRVTVAGYHRGASPPESVAGVAAAALGRTHDAALARRALSVTGTALRRRLDSVCLGADLVLARNLKMLALAVSATRRVVGPVSRRSPVRTAAVVYECLDVHGVMLGPGVRSKVMRGVERALLARCAGLVVSSPAFVDEYFRHLVDDLPRTWLLENKVLESEVDLSRRSPTGVAADTSEPTGPPTGPLTIGWFGNLRCRRSLEILSEVCRRGAGDISVVVRGRVARDQIPDFDAVVRSTPNMRYPGPYDRTTDLPEIYGEVDVVWAIDLFQAGQNSDWLLPNRLYEGVLYGAVPIAVAGTQIARWLADRAVGVAVEAATADAVLGRLGTLTYDHLVEHRDRVESLDQSDLVLGRTEQRRFMSELADLAN